MTDTAPAQNIESAAASAADENFDSTVPAAEATAPTESEAPTTEPTAPAESDASAAVAPTEETPAAADNSAAPVEPAAPVESAAPVETATEEAPKKPDTPAEASFDDIALPPALRRAVDELGFTVPSAIQSRTIPPLLEGRDVIGVAQTGTGKTAAFGLPLLAAIDPSLREVQALVLAPTRELAMQVADAISSFATAIGGLDVIALYGGSPYGPQERALARGAQVVVGTPGRVMDHMRRTNLRLDAVRFSVLDEADEMLRMGFAEDVEEILSHSPASRQIALFSATMPSAIQRVAQTHMKDPVRVSVSAQSSTVKSVHQTYAVVPFRHRTGALARVLATSKAEAAIVFVRTRAAAEEVGSALVSRGLIAASISGDVPQKEREKIIERLRDGSLQVLVATDVAARGLDVERIGLVVNFDVPREPDAYVHRVGRTGRAGRSGEALTFIGPHERRTLKNIERVTKQTLEEAVIPSPRDVSKHRLAELLTQVPERIERGRLELYREQINEFVAENDVDPLELAAVLGAMTVGDDGPGAASEEPEFTAKLSGGDDRSRGDRDQGPRGEVQTERGYTSYKIGVGHTHGARPPAIVGAITGEGGLNGKDVGKIQIFPSFALVQIRGSLDEEQIDRIAKARVGGRSLRISPDNGPRGGKGAHGSDRGGRQDGDRPWRRNDERPRRDEGGRHDAKRKSFRHSSGS